MQNPQAIGKQPLKNRKEAAKALGISKDMLTEWTRQGCPVVYYGRNCQTGKGARLRYDVDKVQTWLENGRQPSQTTSQTTPAV